MIASEINSSFHNFITNNVWSNILAALLEYQWVCFCELLLVKLWKLYCSL